MECWYLIKRTLFFMFPYPLFEFGECLKMFIFVLLVCFVIYFVIFNAFIGSVAVFYIYEHILNICLNIFRKMTQKCELFPYDFFLWFWRVWVLNVPPHSPTPIPGVNVKVFFWGKNIWKQLFFNDFVWIL